MAQLLLKITANMSGERTKDAAKKRTARFVPWCTAEEFAKDQNAAIADMIKRTQEAAKAKKISGITTKGEVITDKPFLHDGVGGVGKTAERPKLTAARFLHFLAKGITLAHQQEMQTVMADRHGDPNKAKSSKPGEVVQTEDV